MGGPNRLALPLERLKVLRAHLYSARSITVTKEIARTTRATTMLGEIPRKCLRITRSRDRLVWAMIVSRSGSFSMRISSPRHGQRAVRIF